MPSRYLTLADYATYGVADTTADGDVYRASALLDAYLKRPSGLCYLVDTDGMPCAMQGATPRMNYTLQGPISPGSSVAAVVKPANLTVDMIGEVLVIDFGLATMEALVVTGVAGHDTFTFQAVKYAHTSGAVASTGLIITEERGLPAKRSIARVSQLPLITIISCLGRYSYGRRSDQMSGIPPDMNLLAVAQTFGGPPAWIPVPVDNIGQTQVSGEMWIPAGILLAYYSEVRMHYLAGFPSTQVPAAIKTATAALIKAQTLLTANGLGPNVTSLKAGDTQIVRGVSSVLDRDTIDIIAPYRAAMFF